MKTALVFGYRDDAAGSRREAYEATSQIVAARYAFDYVVTVDSGHEVYNRAATRNLGVRKAEEQGCDLVVLCDADSVPEEEVLRAAIEEAYEDSLIHFPFDEVWYLIPKVTKRLANTLLQLSNRAISKGGPSNGGIWVCRPEVWWQSGGQDERFKFYGAEDRAHLAATVTLIGDSVHHAGVLLCAYHNRQLGEHEVWDYHDVELMNRYHDAYKNEAAMRAIIAERQY